MYKSYNVILIRKYLKNFPLQLLSTLLYTNIVTICSNVLSISNTIIVFALDLRYYFGFIYLYKTTETKNVIIRQ